MGFNIYNASAGSGKTFTLTVKYLCIILHPESSSLVFRRILAITFTNKAVNELRTRIISSLRTFTSKNATPENLPMFVEVQRILSISTKELQTRAKQSLKKILHNYGFFEITTIDRFNHRLVKTFSSDMGLPPHLSTSLRERDYLSRAASEVLDRIDDKDPLAKILIDFAKSKIGADQSWNFSSNISEVAKMLLDETHYQHFKTLSSYELKHFIELKSSIKIQKHQITNTLIAKAEHFFKMLNNQGIERSDFSRGLCFDFFKKIENKFFKKINFDTKWILNINDKPLYGKTLEKKYPDKARIIDSLQIDISKNILDIKKEVYQLFLFDNLLNNIPPTAILSAITEQLNTIKKEEALMFISDYNKLISEIIRDHPAPFIYERLGIRYQYYFIDEFQDTSLLQWHNIIPLTAHSIEGQSTGGRSGELYIVGDAKQSIYRWRGGSPDQFIELYNKTTKPFQITAECKSLSYNYRSADDLVTFNNDFFTFISKYLHKDSHRYLYENTARQEVSNKTGGYVQIDFLDKEDLKNSAIAYGEQVFNIIKSAKEDGYCEGDICILVRKNTMANELANYLQHLPEPIAVSTAEGLLLKDNKQIQFINDILYWVQSPEQKELQWRIAYTILNDLGQVTHKILETMLSDFCKHLYEKYQFSLSYYYQLTLYDAVMYIIERFDLRWDNYLQSYTDVVFSFLNESGGSTFEFLDYWSQKESSLSANIIGSSQTIQIMTIHKSKGLEFPIVICPYVYQDIYAERDGKLWCNSNNIIDTEIPFTIISNNKEVINYPPVIARLHADRQEQLELDSVNLLYVAMTRAKDRLYLISEVKSRGTITLSDMLIDYLSSKQIWKNNQQSYSFGKLSQKNCPLSQADEEDILQIDISSQKITALINQANKKSNMYSDAMIFGISLHEVLKEILTTKDLTIALKVFKEKNGKLLSQAVITRLENQIDKIIYHPRLSNYFSKEASRVIFNEREIWSPQGVIRPDKVILENNQVTIIDFKTGKPESSHLTQIIIYGNALSNMGYQVVNKLLVYVNENINIQLV